MVLDTSIVFKWLLNGNEPNRDAALNIIQDFLHSKIDVAIPDFLYIEVANILATKSSVKERQLKESLDLLFSFDMNVYEITDSDVKEAAILAKEHKQTVYDMLFVVLAKRLKTTLLTADTKFFTATKFPFIKLLSRM